MSMSIIARCPGCNNEFLFKTEAMRPRPHCPKCKYWFYIKKDNTQNTQESKSGDPSVVEKKLKKIVEAIVHTKVNEATIEKMLLELINTGTIDTGLVRCMIDFFVKIKGKTEEIDENIDMEALRQIGITSTSGN